MKNVHFENADEAIATLRMATDAACVGIWDRNLPTGLISGSEQYWEILDQYGITKAFRELLG